MVALASLLACVFAGLVPVNIAFSGLGHPAVITVGCVLVLSSGLQATGAVDAFAHRLLPQSAGMLPSLAALIALGALLSAFMNNVGAMALLIPVAIQLAAKHEIPPGRVLMPLAFGTILGGMITLIGTPPNLIVSGFRAKIDVGSFTMFDFSPVGLAIVATGTAFIVLLGWRLVPVRQEADGIRFETGSYFTEVRITAKAKAVGKTLREIELDLEGADAQVVGMVRNDFRVSVPNPGRVMREGDILVIEADPEALSGVLARLNLVLAEDVPVTAEDAEKSAFGGGFPPWPFCSSPGRAAVKSHFPKPSRQSRPQPPRPKPPPTAAAWNVAGKVRSCFQGFAPPAMEEPAMVAAAERGLRYSGRN